MRNSDRLMNIELLRIISMMLITIGHFYGWFFLPDIDMYDHKTITFIDKICMFVPFHVNTFILITGYFGIRKPIKSFCNIYTLCLFYSITYSVIELLFCHQFNFTRIIFPISQGGWWFINIYVCLILISPFLNNYTKNLKLGSWIKTIFVFIFLDVYFSFYQHLDTIYHFGYDLTNMATIYIIGRFIASECCPKIDIRKAMLIFIGAMTCRSMLSILGHHFGLEISLGNGNYCNPLIIIASIGFFLIFLNISISNRVIPFLSSSAISVYLFTSIKPIHPFISACFANLYSLLGSSFVAGIASFFIVIISLQIVIPIYDKLRIKLFSPLSSFLTNKIELISVFINKL